MKFWTMRSSMKEPNFVQEGDSVVGWAQGLGKRHVGLSSHCPAWHLLTSCSLSSLICKMGFPPYLTTVAWFWLSDAVVTDHAHVSVAHNNQMGFLTTFHVGCGSVTALRHVPFSLKGAARIRDMGNPVAEGKSNVGPTRLFLLLLGHGTEFHPYSSVRKKFFWLGLGCEVLSHQEGGGRNMVGNTNSLLKNILLIFKHFSILSKGFL